MELMLPKGMRDRDPAEKILQLRVLDTIRTVFELYGYAPLETPAVERMDVLTAKFAAGETADVMKEIFQVSDQGDRELGLRYDHTVPLCRYVAMNPNVKLPFKRYSIGKVYRDGPIKLGRYREFWQADADIIGVPSPLADCEGVMVAAEVFRRLELDVVIKVGSREILNDLMAHVGLDQKYWSQATISLDKLAKIGAKEVLKEMTEAGVPADSAKALLEVVSLEGSNEEKLEQLSAVLGDQESLSKMAEILELLSHLDVVEFDPTLARGLQYYTGFIYECFLRDNQITSSLIGSGRYDEMIGQFLDGKQDFPAVGFSFGVSVICEALKEKGVEMPPSTTRAYVVAVSENERSYALELAHKLREAGINTDMDMLARGIGKCFAYADVQAIPYVVVVGEDEMADGTATLKDMSSGVQQTMSFDELMQRVQLP